MNSKIYNLCIVKKQKFAEKLYVKYIQIVKSYLQEYVSEGRGRGTELANLGVT